MGKWLKVNWEFFIFGFIIALVFGILGFSLPKSERILFWIVMIPLATIMGGLLAYIFYTGVSMIFEREAKIQQIIKEHEARLKVDKSCIEYNKSLEKSNNEYLKNEIDFAKGTGNHGR